MKNLQDKFEIEKLKTAEYEMTLKNLGIQETYPLNLKVIEQKIKTILNELEKNKNQSNAMIMKANTFEQNMTKLNQEYLRIQNNNVKRFKNFKF